MLYNDLKSSIRILNRNRSYALINVLGLSIGIICCLAIFLIVRMETSFDNFHAKADRIYRLVTHKETSNGFSASASSFYPAAKTLMNDFPDIENALVTEYYDGGIISITDPDSSHVRRFMEDTGIGFATSSFFQVFDFELLRGNENNVISNPNSVALSESIAKKYFGDDNPIGKTIRLDNTLDLEVTGIYEDFPSNTDIPFHTMIISFESIREVSQFANLESWNIQLSSIQTFVLLPENYDHEQLEIQLSGFSEKYLDLSEYKSFNFILQPLPEIHTDERYSNYYQLPVSIESMKSLMLIGLLIILTACINFINLSTAQSLKRGKSIGIRKVLGSNKSGLVAHFLMETSIIVLVSLAISFASMGLVLDLLQKFLNFSAPIHFSMSGELMIFAGIIFLLVVVTAGLYPAFIISRFHPLQVIKSRFVHEIRGGFNLRKALIVVQFVISQALIIGVIIVSQQISYFSKSDPGFEKEHILTIPLPENDTRKTTLLKNELGNSPLVVSSSFAMSEPMTEGDLSGYYNCEEKGITKELVALKFADEDYAETFGIELLAGRSRKNTDSVKNVLVNEAFVHRLGIMDPRDAIGMKFQMSGRDRTIIGVVRNFNTQTFHKKINPMLIGSLPGYYYTGGVKISGKNVTETLQHIRKSWEKVFPEYIFDYEFYDKTISRYYEGEQRVSVLFRIFSFISIFISCIGLFGLVTFMAEQKEKEIGIRKVLGATIRNIIMLFSREFVIMIAIALIISTPIAWYLMNNWLSDFAYRITINPALFIGAGVLTLVLTIITVGYKSYRAAMVDPVNTLKDE